LKTEIVQEEALKLKGIRLQYCLLAPEGSASDGASQQQASDSLNSITWPQEWLAAEHGVGSQLLWRTLAKLSNVVVVVNALLRLFEVTARYSDVILSQVFSGVFIS